VDLTEQLDKFVLTSDVNWTGVSEVRDVKKSTSVNAKTIGSMHGSSPCIYRAMLPRPRLIVQLKVGTKVNRT